MGGLRTTSSAGALYPIELYITVSRVQEFTQGLYKYQPQQHTVQRVAEGDKSDALSNAALSQTFLRKAAVNVILCGNVKRTAVKYGTRAERYVQIEVGAVCQNIYLQAYAIGLGTVSVGAFRDDAVHSVLRLPAEEQPFGIMPIGRIFEAVE
jgi:SagB-type dehydrogenase family enzyme